MKSLQAIDVNLFNQDMGRLLKGEEVEIPSFNFIDGAETVQGRYLKTRTDDDILVIEGIHCLNDELSYFTAERKQV